MSKAISAQSLPSSSGIVLMIGASAFVAATSLVAKALGLESAAAPGLNPFQVSAGRFVFALATLGLVLALLPTARPRLSGARWRWHLLRSLCGWLGVTCMFAAVAKIPVAEATAISFLSPLVTMAFAVLLLGENVGTRNVVAAGLAIIGAVLILRPGTEAFQPAGMFAFAAAALMGLEAIVIKMLSDTEPAARVLLINNMIGAMVSLVAASFVWIWPTVSQWYLLVALGAIMVSGQTLFIQAMKRGEASLVIPAFYSVLVFAGIYDYLVFGARPALLATVGSALIACSALLLAAPRAAGKSCRWLARWLGGDPT
ncbi:MAG: DMT family transporter [Geminicoccaceae bacterium]